MAHQLPHVVADTTASAGVGVGSELGEGEGLGEALGEAEGLPPDRPRRRSACSLPSCAGGRCDLGDRLMRAGAGLRTCTGPPSSGASREGAACMLRCWGLEGGVLAGL